MNIWHVILLGYIEGITEFLPISSTSHLILASNVFHLPKTDYQITFDICIQMGAILAVVVLYWKRMFLNAQILKRVLVSFIPTAISGFIFYPFVKNNLLRNESVIIITLFAVGVIFILMDQFYPPKETLGDSLAKIPISKCLAIGFFQTLALIPGVSRSGASIIGGILIGLDRRTAVEFSFLLAVPTLLSAGCYDLLKSHHMFSQVEMGQILLGMLVSFIFAILSIKFFLDIVSRKSLTAFGIYRMAIALIFWFVL